MSYCTKMYLRKQTNYYGYTKEERDSLVIKELEGIAVKRSLDCIKSTTADYLIFEDYSNYELTEFFESEINNGRKLNYPSETLVYEENIPTLIKFFKEQGDDENAEKLEKALDFLIIKGEKEKPVMRNGSLYKNAYWSLRFVIE